MKTRYKVYLKDALPDAEPITLEYKRFEFDENRFTLFDQDNNEVKDMAYLSLSSVAAIIPEKQDGDALSCFKVYLKGRKDPVEVNADNFDVSQKPSVLFYWSGWQPPHLIKGVYVALSEVVAILPAVS